MVISKYYGNAFYGSYLLNTNDRLIKATFHGDTVDLVIERYTTVFNKQARNFCGHVENEYTTLHRTEIASIEFIKY